MPISNFIPTIWSENLWRALDRQYIGASHCCRDYEGDIKEKGSRVKIIGVENVTVSNYNKNTSMSAPQTLNDSARELIINQAKYFNFQIDDIDHAQALPKLMDSAIHSAAAALANAADKYIFSLHEDAGYIVEADSRDSNALLKAFLDARTILYRNDVVNSDDLVLEVTPDVAKEILRSKQELESDNTEVMETGCIGKLYGVKVFVSNNVAQTYTGTQDPNEPESYHKCFMRTKRAIAYASQLSEIEAYRPEQRFADAVKGLHLYGAKIIYPGELVLLNLGIAE